MNAALALVLGHRQPRTFEGSASERRTYERARRLWLAAALHVRGEAFIRPTLGATVSHVGGWFRWAS
jgi:hypothetical protein